jgi:phosphatidylserine/phosphatidylglycerophosphate/cardiolipin synthase-like enzyme
VFLAVLSGKQKHLNYLFLDKWAVTKKLAAETQEKLNADRYNQVAVGSQLEDGVISEYLADRWAAETFNPLSKFVRYTHTKFMLVDPLGDDPVVISGSANFSDASTVNNDENMLVIRGDKRVADIYVGEFMRLWQHYRFRFIEQQIADGEIKPDPDYKPNYLDPTPKWTDPYYKKATVKCMKREAFSVPMAHGAGN